jgi:hypothetical protein
LLVLVAVKGLDLPTASACAPRGKALFVGHPVHLLARSCCSRSCGPSDTPRSKSQCSNGRRIKQS